jgi:hypothetical protein
MTRNIENNENIMWPAYTPCNSPKKKYTKEVEMSTMSAKRIEAFAALANKAAMDRKLLRTNMCKSVANNTPCPHGEKCRFAHSLDELNVSDCVFGDECRFIAFRCNNSSKTCKTCRHKHPQESREEFFERISRGCSQVREV